MVRDQSPKLNINNVRNRKVADGKSHAGCRRALDLGGLLVGGGGLIYRERCADSSLDRLMRS